VNLIHALQLVGQATARLPVGVPDPVLHGSSAIELYTGGLWPAADLDLYASEPRPLIAELFGMGFWWAERPRSGGRGLWHPELQIGINIGSDGARSNLAELSNVLTVINDLDLDQRAQVPLRVIGIEDLIARQVAGYSMLQSPFSESASLIRVLVALAREGVGGRFRAGYLQRRITWDTDGEVVLEGELSGQAVECDPAPRFTGLTRMQALIGSWHVRCGFSFDRPRLAVERLPHRKTTEKDRHRNGEREGQGGTGALPRNIIPFGGGPHEARLSNFCARLRRPRHATRRRAITSSSGKEAFSASFEVHGYATSARPGMAAAGSAATKELIWRAYMWRIR
jgi:hypothetical protein